MTFRPIDPRGYDCRKMRRDSNLLIKTIEAAVAIAADWIICLSSDRRCICREFHDAGYRFDLMANQLHEHVRTYYVAAMPSLSRFDTPPGTAQHDRQGFLFGLVPVSAWNRHVGLRVSLYLGHSEATASPRRCFQNASSHQRRRSEPVENFVALRRSLLSVQQSGLHRRSINWIGSDAPPQRRPGGCRRRQ